MLAAWLLMKAADLTAVGEPVGGSSQMLYKALVAAAMSAAS